MSRHSTQKFFATGHAATIIAFCVIVKFTIFFLSANRYGFISDELYFLDASTHPALGYADFPPMIAWLSALIRLTLGESLWSIRFVAMLIGLCSTLVALDLCRAMGGGRIAQWLTALALLFAPGVLSVQSLLTMNVMDQLWWLLAFRFLLAYLGDERPAAMWLLGSVLGIGLLTKLSILALCLGIAGAVMILKRDLLRRRETMEALLITLICAMPFMAWQFRNDFPMLNFVRDYNAQEPLAIVLQRPLLGLILTMNPVFALLWIPGAACIFLRTPASLRILGTAAWLSIAFLLLAGVKFYFAIPVMMFFVIFGAVWWEGILGDTFSPRSVTALVFILVAGLVTLPVAAPMLPVDSLQKWTNQIQSLESDEPGSGDAPLERLFPHFAEMHGWEELVALTTEAFENLTPAEREGAMIVAAHYGQAASLNRLDHGDRLPQAHGGHMSYQVWGEYNIYDHGLFIGFDEQNLHAMFAVVELRGDLNCRYCMRRERDLQIFYVDEPLLAPAAIRDRIARSYFF